MGFFARRTSDPHGVFDLTAETFLEALRSWGSSPPAIGRERAWLFAIARRVYARECERAAKHRDAARRHDRLVELDQDEIEQVVSRVDAERQARELLDALATLSQLDRETVELVELAGLTPKEAARALGVSAGALRVRLFRARKLLRKGSGT